MDHRNLTKGIIIFFCLFVQMAFSTRADVQITKTFTFSASDFVFKKDQGYDVVNFKKPLDLFGNVGQPGMPARSIQLIVPCSTQVTAVNITPLSEDTIQGEFLLIPRQPPRMFGKPPPPFVPPDSTTYNSSTSFPAEYGKYIRGSNLKEAHIITVQLYPLRWIPRKRKLLLTRSLRIDLTLKPSSEGPLKSIRRSSVTQFEFEKYLTRIVDNPEDISKYLTKPQKLEPGFKNGKNGQAGKLFITSIPSLEGSFVDYVIITNQACSSAYQPLVNWKTQKGLPGVIRTTEWIKDRYLGSDLQEKIRNFIKEAHIYWGSDYFLLGGNSSIIPGRILDKWWVDDHYEWPLSDLYYAGLEGSWNADGDSLYGERYSLGDPGPDVVDLDPDVWVGRIPISEPGALPAVISKIREYEEGAPPLQNYFKKTLLACGIASFEGDFDEIAEIPGIPDGWRYPPEMWKLYCYSGNEQISVANFLRNLGEGYGIISHHDHCTPYWIQCGWSLGQGCATRSDIEGVNYDIDCSILMTTGCHPSDFRFECIAGRFLKKPNGGGVAAVAYTLSGWVGEVKPTNYHFHFGLFGDGVGLTQIYRLGMLTEYTRTHTDDSPMGFDHRYYCLTLFGDPDMPVWTDDPKTLYVQHPSAISMGQQPFVVNVSDGISPVDSALVCLEKFNAEGAIEAYAYKYTGDNEPSGQATFIYTPETEGTIYVTVTGRKSNSHNFRPYEGTCSVTLENPTPYVFPIRGEQAYLDNPPGGNGDGKPNPGESMDLTVNLKNSGNAIANSVHAHLWVDAGFITITQADADYGNIQPDETKPNLTPFHLEVASSCPDVHDATIVLTITDAGGVHTWHDKFTLTVLGDSLKFVGHSRVQAPSPNQSYTIDSLSIMNCGSGCAEGVTATLTCNNSQITITQGTSTFDQILAGATGQGTPAFAYTTGSNPPSEIPFDLTIHDKYGRTWTKRFGVWKAHAPTCYNPLPNQGMLDLKWERNSQDAAELIGGYDVFRCSDWPGGPYTKVNAKLIPNNAYFHDSGLDPSKTYYYTVTAVDTSYNSSVMSNEVHSTTNFSFKSGWPQLIPGNGVRFSSPVVGRIVPPGPNIPQGRQLVIGGGDSKVYAWYSNGWLVSVNWPVSVSGPVETSPALGDFDGDGNDEVVAAVKNPSGGTDIYVWNGSGYPLTNWPKHITEEIEDSPVLADVDGNGTLDILLGTTIGNVYAWNYSTGNALLGWPPTNKPDCSVRGIVVGNAQGDWHNEVYAAATTVSSPEHATIYGWDFQGTKLTGWPHNSPTHVFGSLALGDYDKDGNLEVVGVQDTLGGLKLKSWTGAGARKLTTSLGVGMSCASPALGDVRNSGYLDVFFADSWGGNLRAWNYQWILQSQFSKNIGSIWASPSLGRFLGQNKENVFVGHCAAVYGYDSTGLDLSGWPQQEVGSVTSTPCLTDLDGDGQTEMISATEDGWVYVWALGTLYDREHQDWPMYMHDRWHTGRYSQIVSGNLPGNTIWEGDIEVKGNVTVLAGQTLTIKPGTVVKFRGAYRLIVNANATLNAIGTLLDSIYFTSSKPNPAPNDWTGIDVSGTANLQFCAVRYGNNNLTGQTNSILNVSSSRFTNAAAAGIVLRRGPHNVSYCDISNNNLFGINVWGAWANGVNATIQNNTLAQNQKYGIYAHFNINSGTVSVNSNTINFMWMPPINPSLSGIKCDTVTNVVKLYANNISGYGQDGINMLRSSPKCTCNVISSINNNGLYFYNGSSVVTHNSVDAVNIGAYVTGPATSTTVPNLGNGVAGSDGLNGIVGNTWRGYNTLGTQVKAQNNWWGGYPPDPAWFSGSWDYTRPLPSPPASCGGGGGGPQMGELLEQQLPRVFALAQSRPNPSTGELVIHYQLPKACDVSIKIYNVSGQLVKNMVKGPQKAGYYAASWKGRDETGHAVRSGVYFYKMEAGEFRAIRKLVIVR